MKRKSPIAARAAVHLLLWTALLALMVGTHQSLRFCIGSCCQAMVTEDSCGSGDGCCCKAKPGRANEEGGSLSADVRCETGCCIDVDLAFEHGPLPKRVVLEDGPQPTLALPLADLAAVAVHAGLECDLGAPPTGPPRRDGRTLLLSSTILRL